MEVISPSATFITISPKFSIKPHKSQSLSLSSFNLTINALNSSKPKKNNCFNSSSSSSSLCVSSLTITRATSTPESYTSPHSLSTVSDQKHWMVIMENPEGLSSKSEILDYYAKTLERVLGSEKDARTCIYDASLHTHFGFCCELDEKASQELARLPGVLSVRPDSDFSCVNKDYSLSTFQSGQLSSSRIGNTYLFPGGSSKHWLVRVDKPGVGVVTKAQMVDFYVQILTKVLGNEKDAQMCIYHISWQSNFGFCCELDDECAQELAGVPAVLSVQLDENFESGNKDYGGDNLWNQSDLLRSSGANQPTNIQTKKLFVTGLSFYTSEKTLRAAFEGFGELVEVKIIMDKISKRSKGYAFVEYATVEAASAALKEMNGKIINGWMIVVDVAKTNPRKNSTGRPRPVI